MFKSFAAGFLVCAILAPAWADDSVPQIEEIMKKVNSKKAGLQFKLVEGVKASDPKWDDMGKQAKDYKKLIDFLAKNNPPKGDKSSWETMTKKYSEGAAKVEEAVSKKDKDGTTKALESMNKMCGSCHKAHKPD